MRVYVCAQKAAAGPLDKISAADSGQCVLCSTCGWSVQQNAYMCLNKDGELIALLIENWAGRVGGLRTRGVLIIWFYSTVVPFNARFHTKYIYIYSPLQWKSPSILYMRLLFFKLKFKRKYFFMGVIINKGKLFPCAGAIFYSGTPV